VDEDWPALRVGTRRARRRVGDQQQSLPDLGLAQAAAQRRPAVLVHLHRPPPLLAEIGHDDAGDDIVDGYCPD
jgi:hypothetical protein